MASRERARVMELGDGSGTVVPPAVLKMQGAGVGAVVVFMVCVRARVVVIFWFKKFLLVSRLPSFTFTQPPPSSASWRLPSTWFLRVSHCGRQLF